MSVRIVVACAEMVFFPSGGRPFCHAAFSPVPRCQALFEGYRNKDASAVLNTTRDRNDPIIGLAKPHFIRYNISTMCAGVAQW
ncbi:MAG: hypothetical protein PHN17_03020 [Syntrophaceticus sp.]|nr:hypothetical protein [Syntrophaceticus sp.]